MDHISPALDRILGELGLKQGVLDYQILARWESIVGSPLSGRTRPLRIQDGTLWVYVDNSTLYHHLGYLVPRIIGRIRQEVPSTSVQRVRFTLRESER